MSSAPRVSCSTRQIRCGSGGGGPPRNMSENGGRGRPPPLPSATPLNSTSNRCPSASTRKRPCRQGVKSAAVRDSRSGITARALVLHGQVVEVVVVADRVGRRGLQLERVLPDREGVAAMAGTTARWLV